MHYRWSVWETFGAIMCSIGFRQNSHGSFTHRLLHVSGPTWLVYTTFFSQDAQVCWELKLCILGDTMSALNGLLSQEMLPSDLLPISKRAKTKARVKIKSMHWNVIFWCLNGIHWIETIIPRKFWASIRSVRRGCTVGSQCHQLHYSMCLKISAFTSC